VGAIHRDAAIVAGRRRHDAVLACPELVALRARIEDARQFEDDERRYLVSERRLASHRHEARPDRYGASNHILEDAERNTVEAARSLQAARFAYHTRRDELLAEAGALGPFGQTTAEREADAAYRQTLLDCPPIGWGHASPTRAERVARWQARPESDRLADNRPRDVDGPSGAAVRTDA
jgi:hypothetical protein